MQDFYPGLSGIIQSLGEEQIGSLRSQPAAIQDMNQTVAEPNTVSAQSPDGFNVKYAYCFLYLYSD